MSERPPGWTRLAAPGLIALLVFLVFAPALDAGFVSFDDLLVVTRNPHFRGLDGEHLTWMFTTGHAGHYQPLTWISLALDHAAAGLEPGRYHLVNVALHALVAVAFWFTAVRLLALGRGDRAVDGDGGRLACAALAATLFFALHPLRVESVAWITERRDVLSALGFVLAVGAWLRWAEPDRSGADNRPAMGVAVVCAALSALAFRSAVELAGTSLEWGPGGPLGLALAGLCLALSIAAATRITRITGGGRSLWYWIAVLLLCLSLLSKAWGIVLPAVVLILDVWPLGRLRRERLVGLLAEKAPLFALSFVFASLAAWAQGSVGTAMASLSEHGLGERLSQASYGLAWYPAKTVAPAQLSVIYELPAVLDPLAPRFLIPELLVLIVALVLLAFRRRLPGALAACAAFAVIVSPVLGLAQSGPQLVADRYSYLACMPLALLLGAGVLRASASGAAVARGVMLLAVLVLVALGLAARDRTHAWHDSTSLWEAAYAVDDQSPMTLLNLGVAREEAAREELEPARRLALLDEARSLLERAFDLDPTPLALANLARVHGQFAELNRARYALHRGRALDAAERAFELASSRGTPSLELRLTLGAELLNSGRADEALGHLQAYVDAYPENVVGLLNLGKAHGIAGRYAAAIEVLERATRLDPESLEAWGTLGVAREGAGDLAGAEQAYRRVLALEPGNPAVTALLRGLEEQR